ITRPHTASGATKALQDARCLEAVLRSNSSLDAAVREYNQRRYDAGNQLVELGRRMGRDQVLETPPWPRMDATAMGAWLASTLAGQGFYLFPQSEAE
ncbi:MAG: FAD-dependent monooxygenase, partial [Stackebrandtia sp.]